MSEYREKLLSVGFLSHGRDRPRVTERRDDDSGRIKETVHDDGPRGSTLIRDHARGDRRDVVIRPKTIHVATAFKDIC